MYQNLHIYDISKKRYKLMNGANGIMFGIEIFNDYFYLDHLNVSNENEFLDELKLQGSQKVKLDKSLTPAILEVSESGYYGIIACQDTQLQNGQIFITIFNGKKVVLKHISPKQFNKCVTCVHFIQKYNAMTGMQGSTEVIEHNSPEAIIGTSDGEIYLLQWVKNGIITKLIGNAVASQICQLEGTAPNKITGIHTICINHQSFSNFCNNTSDKEPQYLPETKNWHQLLDQIDQNDRKDILQSLNIIITFIICGISVQVYKQNCMSAFDMKINEDTQILLSERAEFIHANQVPQRIKSILQTYQNYFSLFWAVQTRSGEVIYVTEIKIYPFEIIRQRLKSLNVIQVVSSVQIDEHHSDELQVYQLGTVSLSKTEILNGIVPVGHFVIVNGTTTHALINLITMGIQVQTNHANNQQINAYLKSSLKSRYNSLGKSLDNIFAQIYVEVCYFCSFQDKNGTSGFVYQTQEEKDLWKWHFDQKQFQLALNNSMDWETSQIVTKAYAQDCIEENVTWSNAIKAAQLFAAVNLNIFDVYQTLQNKQLYHAAAVYIKNKLKHHLHGYMSIHNSQSNIKSSADNIDKAQKSIFTFRQLLVCMIITSEFANIQLLKELINQTEEQENLKEFHSQSITKPKTHVRQLVQHHKFNQDFFQTDINEILQQCQLEIENFVYKDRERYAEEQKYINGKQLRQIANLYQLQHIYDSYIISTMQQNRNLNLDNIPQNISYETLQSLIKQQNQRNKSTIVKKILKQNPQLILQYFSVNTEQEIILIQSMIPYLFNMLLSRQFLQENRCIVRNMLSQRVMKLSQLDVQYILHYFHLINGEMEAIPYFQALSEEGLINQEIVINICKKYEMRKLIQTLQNGDSIHEQDILDKLYQNQLVTQEEVMNMSNAGQIYFGIEKETLIQKYLQLIKSNSKSSAIENKAKYDQLFNYIESLQLQASEYEQIIFQKKAIMKIFDIIKSSGCYKLSEALRFIPPSYTVSNVSDLIKHLFEHTTDTSEENIFDSIQEQRSAIQQNQVDHIYFERFEHSKCHQCGALLSQRPKYKRDVPTNQFVVFPCCHSYHGVCYVKYFSDKGVAIAKGIIKLIKQAQTKAEMAEVLKRGLSQLPTHCMECDYTQIPQLLQQL